MGAVIEGILTSLLSTTAISDPRAPQVVLAHYCILCCHLVILSHFNDPQITPQLHVENCTTPEKFTVLGGMLGATLCAPHVTVTPMCVCVCEGES